MSIVLIGYRGSGKTTLGRGLARELKWRFIDLDELIVQRVGFSIREIFEQQGEGVFRKAESDVLLDALGREDHVISLGGGAVLAEENRRAIANSGHVVIYLRAEPEELHRRIAADPLTAANRPGLTRLGGSVEEVRELLAQRGPIYQQVKTIELDVNAADTEALIRSLLLKLPHSQLKTNPQRTTDN
jgi:shikimate kinase